MPLFMREQSTHSPSSPSICMRLSPNIPYPCPSNPPLSTERPCHFRVAFLGSRRPVPKHPVDYARAAPDRLIFVHLGSVVPAARTRGDQLPHAVHLLPLHREGQPLEDHPPPLHDPPSEPRLTRQPRLRGRVHRPPQGEAQPVRSFASQIENYVCLGCSIKPLKAPWISLGRPRWSCAGLGRSWPWSCGQGGLGPGLDPDT